jgi:hypothetical protein
VKFLFSGGDCFAVVHNWRGREVKKIKNVQENLPIIFIAIAVLLLFINDLDSKEKDIYIEIKIAILFLLPFRFNYIKI